MGGSRWPDRIVTWGLVLLLVSTPLVCGVAYLGSLELIETVSFALVVVWMAKVCVEAPRPVRVESSPRDLKRIVIPAAALVALLTLQLIPLPGRVLRLVSPETYRVYQVSLPGWPLVSPAQGLAPLWKMRKVERGRPAATCRSSAGAPGPSRRVLSAPHEQGLEWLRWRTLSIAPSATTSGLLEGLAMGSVFFLVVLYPFGLAGELEADVRFYSVLVFAVLGTAVVVSLIGLAERAWWNGKILWFYVPLDWGGPLLVGSPRASGPFVNADHFSNYLVMALPMALAGALFPFSVVSKKRRADAKLFCAAAAFVIVLAVALSLSRGGWIAGVSGAFIVLALCFSWARVNAPPLVRRLGIGPMPLAIGGFVAVLLLALYVIGPQGRAEIGTRAGVTITQGQDLSAKAAAWKPTMNMIANFSLFGVGLSCWPEIFPHYQRPPWAPFSFYREAENDYLQFTAEAGLAGLALVIWFLWEVAGRLRGAASQLLTRQWPLFAGLIAGAAAALLHEGLDFSFHTPANLLLFTVLIAMALRVALTTETKRADTRLRQIRMTSWRTYAPSICGGAAALGLIVATYVQNGSVYPYGVGNSTSLAKIEADLVAHPAMQATHIALIAHMAQPALPELRDGQLRAAVWLEPTDPQARDLYAKNLLLAGRRTDALQQIELSVYHAPRVNAHYYLAPALVPWLLPEEQTSIVDGFRRAVADQFPGSIEEFAEFYDRLGRPGDVAELYAKAALGDSDDSQRSVYLVKAGRNYGLVGDIVRANEVLREAERIEPTDPAPYTELARSVFIPAGDMDAAQKVTMEGIRQGADPYKLEMALAEAAAKAGDEEAAAQALERGLRYEPTFEGEMRLGDLYLSQNHLERAVLTIQRATEIRPNSAGAFYELGLAEEKSYDYSAAAKAYARAAALAPDNEFYRRTYLEFQERTAEAAKREQPPISASGISTDPTPGSLGDDSGTKTLAVTVPDATGRGR